jgi:hypothetical protein
MDPSLRISLSSEDQGVGIGSLELQGSTVVYHRLDDRIIDLLELAVVGRHLACVGLLGSLMAS